VIDRIPRARQQSTMQAKPSAATKKLPPESWMTRVLIVDDDPVLLKIYKHALSNLGLQTETAPDGIAALKAMHLSRPDIVILDLMMPRLSGPDVLKSMRATPELAEVPVIVLSNAYMDALARDAADAGAQAGLLKVRCTPSILAQTIKQVLHGEESPGDVSGLLAVPKQEPQPETKTHRSPIPAGLIEHGPSPPLPGQGGLAVPAPELTPEDAARRESQMRSDSRREFLAKASDTCVAVWNSYMAFNRALPGNDRAVRLRDLYRRMHFLSASAGFVECQRIAQLATALEALLFQMMDDPSRITASALSTTSMAIDLFHELFREADSGYLETQAGGKVLVIDDDPIANRMVVWALSQVNLQARSTEDPLLAFRWAQQEQFDVVLLDVEMPGISGFEWCKRLRAIPQYTSTPVIYVTVHSNFESLARSVISGGNDILAKPILPMELAVKTVMHLLKLKSPKK
jgi:CheY-like chemotaxis protein